MPLGSYELHAPEARTSESNQPLDSNYMRLECQLSIHLRHCSSLEEFLRSFFSHQ
jgi:hypothetical protein